MHEDVISQVGIFSTLDKRDVQLIAKSCQERSYPAGAMLFKQGDGGVGLYVLKAGHVRVMQARHPDRAEEELAVLGPGDVLGEMALLDDLPRSASVIAIEDVTALLLPVWDFRVAIRDNPEIALRLLAVMSRRLRKAETGE